MMRAFALILLLSACVPILGSNVGKPQPGSTQFYNDWVAFGGAFDFRKEPGVLEMFDPSVKPDASNARLTEARFSQECDAAGGSAVRGSSTYVIRRSGTQWIKEEVPFPSGGIHQMACQWEGDQ